MLVGKCQIMLSDFSVGELKYLGTPCNAYFVVNVNETAWAG